MLYQIVIMENKKLDDRAIVATSDEKRFKEKTETLTELGYVMVEFFNTFDKSQYLEIKCKFAVQQLKEESYQGTQLLVKLVSENSNNKVIHDTEKLIHSNLELHIKQVGRLYSRYLTSCSDDHEPTYQDELAIQCYNYRESHMRISNILAKSDYSIAQKC